MFLGRRNLIKVFFTRPYSTFLRFRNDPLNNIFIEKPEVIKWDEIRQELFKNDRTVNKTNIDGIVLSKCFNGARLDIAESYIDYLKTNNIELTDAFKLKTIRLYYNWYRMNKDEFTARHVQEVEEWCKEITEKHQILDVSSAENIIHGLVLTRDWRKAENYFEMLTEKALNKSTYSAFISKAIAERDYTLAWKYLNFLSSNFVIPRSYVFNEWFDMHAKDNKKIEEMLEYISEHGILLPESELNSIMISLNSSYHCALVTINRKGTCPSCKNKLPGVKLMNSEFQNMATRFLEDIIIKSDVFIKSNPKEIERFKKFVDKSVPFDCVIDGLNVAYSQGNKLGPKVYSKILAQVVKQFADQKQKCLVIGKRHMEGWPKKEMNFIKQNSALFMADD